MNEIEKELRGMIESRRSRLHCAKKDLRLEDYINLEGQITALEMMWFMLLQHRLIGRGKRENREPQGEP